MTWTVCGNGNTTRKQRNTLRLRGYGNDKPGRTAGHAVNENLYRIYRQNLRRNTTVKEYRQMHKLERALIIWPLHVYMWVKRRRTQPPPIEPPTGGFLMPENSQEE